MKRAVRMARHFIRAHDLRAVFVARSASGLVRVGMTAEPDARRRALGRDWRLVSLWWCSSSAAAGRVIEEAAKLFPGVDRRPFVRLPVGPVAADVVKVARGLGVGLTADASVQDRAVLVVADIESRVRAMNSAGHLRAFNAEYHRARAEAAKAGRPFRSYGDHLERYKIGLLYQIARGVSEAKKASRAY